MRVVVTCGPSFEPLDQVRRLTNFSTGELGVLLANALTKHDVICFKGEGATTPLRVERGETIPFTTNDHLLARLDAVTDREKIGAVFHAAALTDFRVKTIRDARGEELRHGKISSATDELNIVLVPVPKIIDRLRKLFPASLIVGWKYEVESSREDAIKKAQTQIEKNGTDACVVNGPAYGAGFGFCQSAQTLRHLGDKPALAAFLVDWLGQR